MKYNPVIEYEHHIQNNIAKDMLAMDREQLGQFLNSGVWTTHSLIYLQQVYAYLWGGSQCFCVGPNMQELLVDTTLRGIEWEEFKLPYEAFYVATPCSPWKIWGGLDTEWHSVEGVYVARQMHPVSGEEIITFYIWGIENENSQMLGDDASFFVNANMAKAREYPSMDEYIIDLLATSEFEDSAFDIRMGFPQEKVEEVYNGIREIIHMVFNLLIYLDCIGAERSLQRPKPTVRYRQLKRKLGRTNGKKRREILAEMKAQPMSTVTYLGTSIEGREIKSASERGPMPRQRVRGHWRKIPYGPRDNPTYKRKRIEPYWRGSDLVGIVESRVYDVQG